MSGECIRVVGPRLRVGIVGAYLAARWLEPGRILELSPEPEEEHGEFLTRPNVHRFHGEIGLPIEKVMERCGGAPAFCTPAECADGATNLPFSAIGLANRGVDFHQYWLRADQICDQPELMEFSLSLALDRAASPAPASRIAQLPVEFGVRLDRALYGGALIAFAEECGARTIGDEGGCLTIDCSDAGGAPQWTGDAISVGQIPQLPGMEWHILSSMVQRLVGLTAPLAASNPERDEWNRLAAAQSERMGDMLELLSIDDPLATERLALRRKVEVFGACGRIPSEDYEVFTQSEWLAALWFRGLRPRRYHRMADNMVEAELIDWMEQLRTQIGQITKEITGQVQAA